MRAGSIRKGCMIHAKMGDRDRVLGKQNRQSEDSIPITDPGRDAQGIPADSAVLKCIRGKILA